MTAFDRITTDAAILNGQPCIRGSRLTVKFILDLLAHGSTVDEILAEYYRLTPDDLRACFLYAVDALDASRSTPALSPASR